MTLAILLNKTHSEAPAIGAAYSIEDWHFATLNRISTHLKKYNCIISCRPDVFYSAAYLSEVAKFMAAALAAYSTSPPTSSMYRWLHGVVPVPYQPQIEITPREAIDYFRKALCICQSNESAHLAMELVSLEQDLLTTGLKHAFIHS